MKMRLKREETKQNKRMTRISKFSERNKEEDEKYRRKRRRIVKRAEEECLCHLQ